MPVVLMVVGVMVIFGAVIFALHNMKTVFSRRVEGDDPFGFTTGGGVFSRHITAAIAVALGGLLFVIGVIWQLVRIFG